MLKIMRDAPSGSSYLGVSGIMRDVLGSTALSGSSRKPWFRPIGLSTLKLLSKDLLKESILKVPEKEKHDR